MHDEFSLTIAAPCPGICRASEIHVWETSSAEGREPDGWMDTRETLAADDGVSRGRRQAGTILRGVTEFELRHGSPRSSKDKLSARQLSAVHIVVVATEVEEQLEDEVRVLRPAWAAGAVAAQCVESGMGLAFIEKSKDPILVFPTNYSVPVKCTNETETGHIPKWLYERVAELTNLSPYLSKTMKAFARKYSQATRGKTVDYDLEVKLLTWLADEIKEGDPRLFVPTGHIQVLREYERLGANKRARDHFFHTFNNLLMGYYILGSLKVSGMRISEVDEFISPESRRAAQLKKLDEWEAIWLLTCLFHDPAYIAENFHSGTFRFSYGIIDDDSGFGAEIQEVQKEKIVDLWENEFRAARELLVSLYSRVLKKWKPPGLKSLLKDDFSEALRRAYFDGRQVSHSLVSGIKLIQDCQHDHVTQRRRAPDVALTGCTIAALSMMFHDQKCRATLKDAGVPPFGFEKLPYAAVLMFVDSVQDDRRDISQARFPRHGVLADLRIDSQNRVVTAEVCLPEVEKGVWGWPGRIAEYRDVLGWVNTTPGVKFVIDYTTRAHLPHRV
jgi:hypothetical protein